MDNQSSQLAEHYLRLGGTRRASIDDNIGSTRKWEDEPAEAAMFWKSHIAPLSDTEKRDVETYLPSINAS